MAVIGYEWLIVVAIIIIIFLWGPKKLPELAKSLGLARKEFKNASQEPSAQQEKDKTQDSNVS